MINRLLICTDLDRTLIPNGTLAESDGARGQFGRLAGHEQVTLAYVSGRHRELVESAIIDYDLPMPDYVLGDVGTTIYRIGPGDEWKRQSGWERDISEDWNGLTSTDLEPALRDLPDLRLQEAARQNVHKLSYSLTTRVGRNSLTEQIERCLDSLGVNARLVWSVDDIEGTDLLDVLPARASKYHAIEALMQEQGFTCDDTVFCGDSGNDIEVLASPVRAVLVANSRPEVQQLALQLSVASGFADRLYIARGNFMGLNGNYSGGMLEGIAHYYPETVDWMEFGNGEPAT